MTESWPIHTLVFDLDDTLYPERDFVLGGFAAAARWLKEARGVDGFAASAGNLFAAGRRGKIFDEALPPLGLKPDGDLLAGLIAAYRQHTPRLNLYPDAAEILPWAAGRFQLALITDGYAEVQARKIRALGLESFINCRIITDELGREFWKPSPVSFQRVMAAFPGPAEGFVYVADNPRKDFIGARALGWRTVRVRRPGAEHAAYEAASGEAADIEMANLLPLREQLVPAGPQV